LIVGPSWAEVGRPLLSFQMSSVLWQGKTFRKKRVGTLRRVFTEVTVFDESQKGVSFGAKPHKHKTASRFRDFSLRLDLWCLCTNQFPFFFFNGLALYATNSRFSIFFGSFLFWPTRCSAPMEHYLRSWSSDQKIDRLSCMCA
jgi:hypothetical protein